jgi:hypothetical protein
MQEIIQCPSCQRKLQVPESLLGQDVQCPSCGATFVASWGSQPPPMPSRGYESPPPMPPREYEPPPHLPSHAGESGQPPPLPRSSSGYPSSYPGQRDYREYDYGNRSGPYSQRRDLMPHRGTTILVLGILSLVMCQILGPIAWIMGNQDLKEIRAGRMDPEGESATTAGRVLGIISTIFLLAVLGLFCCMFMLGMSGALFGPKKF